MTRKLLCIVCCCCSGCYHMTWPVLTALTSTGVWGNICNQEFDNVTATIICRQVTRSPDAVGITYGLNGTFRATTTWPRFATPTGTATIHLDGQYFRGNCLGNESRLIDCIPPQAWGTLSSACLNNPSLSVGILCWPSPTIKADEDSLLPVSQDPYACATPGAYRLVNGPAAGIGRAEVR